MKILFLTQFFDPEPTPKGLSFAKSLARRGHSVTVLTGFPNYPGGKVYDAYKGKLVMKEVMDGIAIYRVPLYPSHSRSKMGRIANYLSFCLSSLFALFFLVWRKDIIYVYHPPVTVGVSAALASLFTRKPFVYDIQDLWPDTLLATGMMSNRKILKVIGWLCLWVYGRATKIVVLSPGFQKLLVKRGVPEKKVELIYNWCDEAAMAHRKSGQEGAIKHPEDSFNVIFAGNIGRAQALDSVLIAAKTLMEENSKVRITFVGGGLEVENLKERARQMNLDNVRFLDQVPMTEIGRILETSDALLVHLKRDPLFEITIPSKTQAYMFMSKPIVMAVSGDAANLVKQSGGGLCVEPENPKALADVLRRFAAMGDTELAEMGRQGRAFYDSDLSIDIGSSRFERIFKEIAL